VREAEESALLEVIARERLLETQHAGKDLESAVICEVWRLAMVCVQVVNKSNLPIQTPFIVS
jgi:hypothetical protein